MACSQSSASIRDRNPVAIQPAQQDSTDFRSAARQRKKPSITANRISSSTRAEYSIRNGHSGAFHLPTASSLPCSMRFLLIVGDWKAKRAAATLKTVASPMSRAEILQLRDRWRAEGKSVVFTNAASICSIPDTPACSNRLGPW